MSRKKKPTPPAAAGDFDSLVSSIVLIHQQTQDFAAKAVNVALTLRNWLIGCRIVEFEQRGNDRAAYGERLLPVLADRLSAAGLKRVDARELRRFRLLYVVYPQIRESLTPELLARFGAGTLQSLLHALTPLKRETPAPESPIVETLSQQLVHRLSFTHQSELIQLPDSTQHRFHKEENGKLHHPTRQRGGPMNHKSPPLIAIQNEDRGHTPDVRNMVVFSISNSIEFDGIKANPHLRGLP